MTPLLFPVWKGAELTRRTVICTQQFYHLLFASKYYLNLLHKEGVETVLLKGAGAASYYPVPEYRKSGDIDLLLLDINQVELACRVLEAAGAKKENEQHANHHIAFLLPDRMELELHLSLTEDFDNAKTNNYLKSFQSSLNDHVSPLSILGVELPVLDRGSQAFSLLLHMLQHYLRSGFGLKMLCDWVVLWNSGATAKEISHYLKLVRGCGLEGFSQTVTKTCCLYLGLKEENIPGLLPAKVNAVDEAMCEEFLREIFDAEEFGKTSSDRMVVLRGDSMHDFLREFHHQMHLNYPRAGKSPLLWPALWTVTLVRFLYNNRKLRHVSLFRVLTTARKRSHLSKKMRLFKT